MTNGEVLKKLNQDMEMRNFSNYTTYTYYHKTQEMMKYFNKPMEEVSIVELRNFLSKYLKDERRLSDRTINYYNSIIRFLYEVTMDKVINKKQIPMRKRKKTVYKVLTKEELSTFFSVCDKFKYKMIYMMIYGSGLRIGEVVNLRIQDIDSKKMRIYVRAGKGNKERYTILPKESLAMLRIYWKKYRQNDNEEMLFLNNVGQPISIGVLREKFRQYRRKAGIGDNIKIHTLRHCFATELIERGATLIQVKELMGHSNIRSTMEYVHVANIDYEFESPLDVFLGEEEKECQNFKI